MHDCGFGGAAALSQIGLLLECSENQPASAAAVGNSGRLSLCIFVEASTDLQSWQLLAQVDLIFR